MKWQATKDKYKVVFSEPTVLYRGAEGDQGWGKNQFPSLAYTRSGKITAHWQYGEDRVGAKGVRRIGVITADGGKTWTEGSEPARPTKLMKNGKYFMGFHRMPTAEHVNVAPYTPAAEWSDNRFTHRMYFLEDMKDEPTLVPENVVPVTFYEYDPETDKTEEIPCTINWPHTPIKVYWYKDEVHTYTISGWFGLNGMNTIVVDGDLYICIYAHGFDSTAKTKEEALFKNQDKYALYIFRSTDCGRTWDFLSQVSPDDIPPCKSEGPCEPKMIQMRDGSFVMLFRTGSDDPMYYTRSDDMCKTWSKPVQFHEYGVLPQLLTLDCGVTLSTFGRPDLVMRVSFDPTGKEWEEAVQLPLTLNGREHMWGNSCCYTNLLPLSDTKALFIYSDFRYPNENGVGVRTILTREISVVEK